MLVARARNANYEFFDLQKLYTSVEVSKKHDVCEEAQRFWTSRSPTLVNPFGCSLSYLWYCCSMKIYARKMVQIVQIFSKKYIRQLLLLLHTQTWFQFEKQMKGLKTRFASSRDR